MSEFSFTLRMETLQSLAIDGLDGSLVGHLWDCFARPSDARIAPVAQRCTHDFVFVFLFVCSEDRSSSLSRLPRLIDLNFTSVHLHPWARFLLACWATSRTHMFLVSRLNEPAIVSQQFFGHTCQLTIQDELIVTVQLHSLIPGCHLSVSNDRSCHAPYPKPSSDCLGATTHVEEFGANWDLF